MPQLEELFLCESSIYDIPRPLLGRDYYENCLPGIRAHFHDLEQGEELDREVKLILLGNGWVGKTSVCRRLIENRFDKHEKSTHGVRFWPWRLKEKEGEERAITVNVWDFGGQDIYYGTHALFHQGRAVFVIVWDAETEGTDFTQDEETQLTHRNYPVQYWLDYVQSVSPGSPVVIVQNKCASDFDYRAVSLTIKNSSQHPLQCRFCAEEADDARNNRQLLVHYLEEAVEKVLGHKGTQRIGVGRWGVKQELRRLLNEEKTQTLSIERYRKICRDHHLDKAGADALLEFLHHSGTVYHQANLFDNAIILDLRWVCDAIYTLLDRHKGCYHDIRERNGQFTGNLLNRLVWREAGYQLSEQDLFIEMMQSCKICFKLGENDRKEAVYLAPDLTPNYTDVAGGCYWEEKGETFYWRYDHGFLGPNVLRQAMIEIGKTYRQSACYWQNGFYLPLNALQSRARVTAEYGQNGNPSPGHITLAIQGAGNPQNKMEMLGILRNAFEEDRRYRWRESNRKDWGLEQKKTGIRYQVSLDGEHWVDLEALKTMRDLGNPHVASFGDNDAPPVQQEVADYLHYLDHLDTPSRFDGETPRPLPLAKNQDTLTPITDEKETKPMSPANPPKVFISYSHETAEHDERIRKLADQLCEKDGIEVELDQYHQRPSQGWPRWCEEQLEPENSDFVLVICTQTYLDRIKGKVRADEGHGVYWEGSLLYDYIYDSKSNTRFIPVLLKGGKEDHIPRPIKSSGWYKIEKFDLSDPGYNALYGVLTNQPEVKKPPRGTIKRLPAKP